MLRWELESPGEHFIMRSRVIHAWIVEALQARDERIEQDLRHTLTYKRDLARQMHDDARELEKQARYIEQEVKAERWYNLEGTLAPEDIESLCRVSPVGLLDGVS